MSSGGGARMVPRSPFTGLQQALTRGLGTTDRDYEGNKDGMFVELDLPHHKRGTGGCWLCLHSGAWLPS
jgi:hypothetical protein